MTGHVSKSIMSGLRQLYGHFTQVRRRQLGLVLLLMLLGAAGELVTLGAILPFLTLLVEPDKAASYPKLLTFFSYFGWNDPARLLLPVTILFSAVALIAGAIRLGLTWVSQRFVFEAGHDLAVEVYCRALQQPYAYHVSKNTSDLIAAVTKVDAVVGGTLMQAMQLVSSAVISVFIIAALVAIDPVVAVSAACGFALLYLVVSYAMQRRLEVISKVWAAAQSGRVKTLQEGLGGIRDVLIDQSQATFVTAYSGVDKALRWSQAESVFIGAAPRYIIEACGMVLIAFMALVLSGNGGGLVAVLPVLGALALGSQRLLPLLQMIYHGWTGIVASKQALFDVLGFLELPVDQRYLTPATALPFDHAIELKSVDFRYVAGGPQVIAGVSLPIPKGSRIGFIGKTGSGKSTITDLIMGLLEPTHGEITIDGIRLAAGTVRGWQAQVAHVPQAIYLADTSIASNIAFGVPEAMIDMVQVRDAARRAQLADFIEGLANGYDTLAGERGIRLSGGQRQRIGIARALYKRANVLVFDEATSALDSETEASVIAAIQSLGRDLTIIIIAHRLSTIEMCDVVVRLDEGRIVEQRRTKS